MSKTKGAEAPKVQPTDQGTLARLHFRLRALLCEYVHCLPVLLVMAAVLVAIIVGVLS